MCADSSQTWMNVNNDIFCDITMFKCILLWFALKLNLKETNTIWLLCVYQMLTANPPKGTMTFQDVLLLHTQRTYSSLTNVIHTEEVVNVLARPPCWLSCNSLPWAQQTLAGLLPLSINEPSWTHLHMNCLTLFVIFSYSVSIKFLCFPFQSFNISACSADTHFLSRNDCLQVAIERTLRSSGDLSPGKAIRGCEDAKIVKESSFLGILYIILVYIHQIYEHLS
jgi:hypothetical protein